MTKTLGQVAYEAAAKAIDHNIPWTNVPQDIKDIHEKVAAAVQDRVLLDALAAPNTDEDKAELAPVADRLRRVWFEREPIADVYFDPTRPRSLQQDRATLCYELDQRVAIAAWLNGDAVPVEGTVQP